MPDSNALPRGSYRTDVFRTLLNFNEEMEATAAQLAHALGDDEEEVTEALRDLQADNTVDVMGDLGGEILWGVIR